ncbi:hypothetical protein [Ekhidna sp.]
MKVILLILISLYSQSNQEDVKVIFDSSYTLEKLLELKKDCEQQGFDLSYENLLFSESGQLRYISFKVDFNDCFSGSTSGYSYNSEGPGFIKRYGKDVESKVHFFPSSKLLKN